jgi:cell fate regulator YaaT (PSP1 superfamily)
MKHIAKVKFQKENMISEYDTRDLDLEVGDQVMVEWEEGLKMGIIIKLKNCDAPLPSLKPLQRVIRKVTAADLDYESRKGHKERDVYQACLAKIKEMGLAMNLVKVEHIPNINKFICYFTAEGRIDFRNLVKKLASDFHARVEMKQIGARNRAKMVGGIGRCGRELCCSTWLTDFRSVNTSSARYQQLSLNPQKLAGQCGKLKCCLNYELDSYIDALKGFPKTDTWLQTNKGVGVFQKMDIFKGLFWYAYKDNPINWVTLTVDQVNEIIKINKQDKKVDSLEMYASELNIKTEEDISFTDVVGQDSLTRFDMGKRSSGKKRNKRRKTSRKNA